MAQDSSVAPKERVNIRYKPATGEAKDEVELPFKMVVVGDFTQREDDTPIEQRERIDVNRDTFTDVMKAQRLELNLRVADKLSEPGDDAQLDVRLPIHGLTDFEPDQIVRQVPELRKLLELRDALNALKGPLGNVPSFRRSLQSLMADPAAREKLVAELGKKTPPKG